MHLVPPPESDGVRIDTGVEEGDAITPFYDPMIAKLIVHGADAPRRWRGCSAALAQYRIVGVANNVEFLGRLVATPSFVSADLDTALIEREHDALFPAPAQPAEDAWLRRRLRRGRARRGRGATARARAASAGRLGARSMAGVSTAGRCGGSAFAPARRARGRRRALAGRRPGSCRSTARVVAPRRRSDGEL